MGSRPDANDSLATDDDGCCCGVSHQTKHHDSEQGVGSHRIECSTCGQAPGERNRPPSGPCRGGGPVFCAPTIDGRINRLPRRPPAARTVMAVATAAARQPGLAVLIADLSFVAGRRKARASCTRPWPQGQRQRAIFATL
jgi:hypothetical protein